MWSYQAIVFSMLFVSTYNFNLYGPPKEASLGERPFHAAIFENDIYRCSAAIISSRCVLTACSCIVDTSVHVAKRLYQHDNFTMVTYTRYIQVEQLNWAEATDLFTAEECNTRSNVNDAAILCTADDKLVGTPVAIVKEATKENVRGIVSGWGLSVKGQPLVQDDLRRAYMRIISLDECRRRYKGIREVPDTALCAVAADEVRGFCAGDIGGPLTHGEGLIGVSVANFGCGRLKLPGIFTNISRLGEFIERVLSDYDAEMRFNDLYQ